MSDSLQIDLQVFKAGSLVDADSTPLLSDPTNAYGVRRSDTLAVVVANNTALTRISTGIYSYTISSPVDGVTYEYYLEVVLDGNTYRTPGSVTLLHDEVPSYLDVAAATSLANQLPGLASFKAANDATKLAALKLASDRFDTARRYQGGKYNADGTQVLEFPRAAYRSSGFGVQGSGSYPLATDNYQLATSIWDWDATNNAAIVPAKVKRAVLFEADAIIDASYERRRKDRFSGLLSQSVGGNSESYAPVKESGEPMLCAEADRISRQYALRSGRIL